MRFARRWIITLAVVAAGALRVSADPGDPETHAKGRTIISDEPWDGGLQKDSTEDGPQKVIYGADNRLDVYQETDPNKLSWAASTCGMILSSQLTFNSGNNTYQIATANYRVLGKPPCAGEAFENQPTAPECTAFLVGPDLIATAGHCFETASDLAAYSFVFGFKMQNATTPLTVVPAANVYTGVQIVDWVNSGALDHLVVRLDRPVTAAGAAPLPIRRTGSVALNTPVGVIGHPWGLPMKIAFGPTTAVHDNNATGYFLANLDTYGGNSGSPVFNQQTGIVEGILVRGATDFNVGPTCFTSNQLPDSPGGEAVTRSTVFDEMVPELYGVSFDLLNYRCGMSMLIRVVDNNLPGSSLTFSLTSTSGDVETLIANDPDNDNGYTVMVPIAASGATVQSGNGMLEGGAGATVTATYNDPNYNGAPQTNIASAIVDCVPPTISNVTITTATHSTMRVNFTASEPVNAIVMGGAQCGNSTTLGTGALAGQHSILLENLPSCTSYRMTIQVTDEAGHVATFNNGGNCFTGSTVTLGPALYDEDFEPTASGSWAHFSTIGVDNWAEQIDGAAHSPTRVYGHVPGSSGVADAYLVSPPLPAAGYLEFWHLYDLELGYDGAVLNYSTNGGANWNDLGSRIVAGGYITTISTASESQIGGRQAWTGSNGSTMTRVLVDVSDLPDGFKIRFRFSSDETVGSGGWRIDDVRMMNLVACPAGADAEWLTVD